MSKFTGKNRIAVRVDEDPNTIWVVDKLNFGMRQRVISAMAHISATTGKGLDDADLSFDVGAFNLAVAREAIIGWEGPDFDGVPVDNQTIATLDFDDPLVKRALEVAAEKAMEAMNPKVEPPVTPTGIRS